MRMHSRRDSEYRSVVIEVGDVEQIRYGSKAALDSLLALLPNAGEMTTTLLHLAVIAWEQERQRKAKNQIVM